MTHHRWTEEDYRSMNWRSARALASARTAGLCQFCGLCPGTEGHHVRYDHPDVIHSHDVTWLCSACHATATLIRRMAKEAGHVLAGQEAARKRWLEILPAIMRLLKGE